MFCEHKRLKSVNCVLYCADCGARLDDTSSAAGAPPSPQGEGMKAQEADAERVTSASGRKIGFEAEKKTAPRRRKKGGNET